MAEAQHSLIERTGRSLVRLRAGMKDAERTASALNLPAEPLRWRGADPCGLWLGPDQWLIVSDSMSAKELVAFIDDASSNNLHAATDMSDALKCFELSGQSARTILSMGCGLDLDARAFAQGTCARTRFTCVAIVIAAIGENQFDLYVDRSYSHYLQAWIASSAQDPITRAS